MPMKVGVQPLSRALHEVDGEQSAARLEHATRFTDGFGPSSFWQMMQHDRAQHDIESCVRERE